MTVLLPMVHAKEFAEAVEGLPDNYFLLGLIEKEQRRRIDVR